MMTYVESAAVEVTAVNPCPTTDAAAVKTYHTSWVGLSGGTCPVVVARGLTAWIHYVTFVSGKSIRAYTSVITCKEKLLFLPRELQSQIRLVVRHFSSKRITMTNKTCCKTFFFQHGNRRGWVTGVK